MSKTLLLADDSVVIQKLVGLSFANEDVEVFTTDNGDDALRRARELRPDLVLADVVMPGKNGYELCEAIKTDPSLSHVPVLMLTGTFEAFDEERAQRVGSAGHVTKPFEAQGLVERVTTLLAKAPSTSPPSPPASDPLAASGSTHLDDAYETQVAGTPAQDADDVYDFFDPEPLEAGGPRPQPTTAPPPIPSEVPQAVVEPESHPTMSLAPDPDVVMFGDDPMPEAAPMPTNVAQATASELPTDLDSVFEFGLESMAGAEATGDPEVDSGLLLDESDPLADLGSSSSLADDNDLLEPLEGEGLAFAPEATSELDPYDVSGSDLGDPFGGDDLAERTASTSRTPSSETSTAPGPGTSETAAPELSPAMRERIHETLEKIAWEAFADVSDSVVRQVVARVESIAWEVIPQMAEALVKEERWAAI